MTEEKLRILDYEDCHQAFFEKLNRSWIEQYFWMEPIDSITLGNPRESILDNGGQILIATWGGIPAGTLALKKRDGDCFEFSKMAVDPAFRGRGIGEALAKKAIARARALGACRIILYSHSSLKEALHLYRKIGFCDVPMDTNLHKRSNVKMELELEPLIVSQSGPEQADAIASIGLRAFTEAFGRFFKNATDLRDYLEKTYDPVKIAASMAKPNNIFFICREGDRAVGFAKMKIQSLNRHFPAGRQSELQKLYVIEPYLGSGAGEALMQAVHTRVLRIRPDLVWLDVLVGNERAIRFYQRSGFTRQGQHFFTIGSQVFDYDIMTMAVQPSLIKDPSSTKKTSYGIA